MENFESEHLESQEFDYSQGFGIKRHSPHPCHGKLFFYWLLTVWLKFVTN